MITGVVPNPAVNRAFIKLAEVSDEAYTIKVISLTGQVVSEQKSESFERQIEIDTEALGVGIYFINITDGNGNSETQKLKVIQ